MLLDKWLDAVSHHLALDKSLDASTLLQFQFNKMTPE
jgi:hypothetical protein